MAGSTSSASTQGIRVSVQSRYIPEQSSPAERRYVFAYTRAQLRSRHWIITDGNGEVEEVRGPGVVGKQPALGSGEFFEYTSGCVLKTAHGTMRGSFQMLRDDGSSFDAEIAAFGLSLPSSLN